MIQRRGNGGFDWGWGQQWRWQIYMDARYILEINRACEINLDVGVKGMGRIEDDSQVPDTLRRR